MSAAAEGFRLSAQQRRLWRLGASPAFCAQAVLRLEGNLDRDALRRAALQAVERHEALRTRFVQPPGFLVPLQIIAPAGTLIWSEGDEEAIAAQRELARDPEAGAMVRFHLVPRGSGHLLVLTANPLAVDGRSLVLLGREIARFYAGEPAEDEPLQFADFVEWEAQLLEEEEGRAFWRKRVSAGSGDTLPFERRGSGAPFAVLRQAVPLAPGDLDRVGADPAVFLLACWRELLARFDRRESLAVSVLSDGRAFDDLAGAVGLYARYLPLPGTLSPETSPRRAARQLGEALREALEWQCHFAWEVWEEELRSPGSPGLAFEHQRLPAAWEAGGVTFAVESLRVCQDRFRIKLAWLEGPGGGSLEIQADAGLFEPDDVASLAGQLAVLLRSAAGRPEAPLSSLDALPENERLRVARFAVDRPAAPAPVPVHHRVEERAAVAPDAPAVVSESELLTYGELNARANRLAHWLRRAGVGPDVPVALWLERSAEVVVALLAVLKAGGAYLPLDPGQPRQRLGFLLEDARPPLLLTRGPLPVGFPEHGARVVDLGAPALGLAAESALDPRPGAVGASLAYLIFTSGSTGRPKAVGVEHRQLAAYTEAALERLSLPAGASFATVTTFAADLGNTAVFPCLVSGGCLSVVSPRQATDPGALVEFFGRHPVDVLKIVPSHLEALLSWAEPERVLPRRALILGGEASSWDLIARVRRLAPGCRVLNHYGPTETTVGALAGEADPGQRDERTRTVPLGRPLAGARIRVLDREGRPVPPWMRGEVHIGGAGVSRGYLHRADLTAERFLPDPWAGEPGARVYRTGDLARWLPDGTLEFLGRTDHQVKLHGFRVELDEIRAALERHPEVEDAVVRLLRDGNGVDLLVACYVARREIEPARLRAFLAESLLEETLPAFYVPLRRLPLTLNGKIDFAALPSLDEIKNGARRPRVLPRNPEEAAIAALWAEVLGIAEIGVEDSFFDLGGHSLLATRVLARLRDTFGVEISLRTLFEVPTVAGLARAVGQARAAGAPEPGLEPAPDPGGGDLERQLAELERMSDDEARARLGPTIFSDERGGA